MKKQRYTDPMELALRAMPGTATEMAAKIGAQKPTVQSWITKLRRAGWAHVGKWVRATAQGSFQPVIHAGPGRDAVCRLKPYDSIQRLRRFRDKARKTGTYDLLLAKNRTRHRRKRLLAKLKGRTPTPFDALLH